MFRLLAVPADLGEGECMARLRQLPAGSAQPDHKLLLIAELLVQIFCESSDGCT
jgi:hypothetical protein